MDKLYIVFALLPEEPYIVYYCGNNEGANKPMFHDAAGLVKQMSLEEAEEVFKHVGVKDKSITFCLMEWTKFMNVYQFTGTSKEDFVKASIKTK
jgi:hypothetical protein